MKLKQLPTLRKKKRYVVFKIYAENRLSYQNVRDAVYNAISGWLGEAGMAKADVHIVKNLWDYEEQTGFIRCSHRFVDDVKASLAAIRQVGDEKTIFQTLRVSGTIKTAKRKLKQLNKPKPNSN
jgi:RNase P/RNase MRP subunit POP5